MRRRATTCLAVAILTLAAAASAQPKPAPKAPPPPAAPRFPWANTFEDATFAARTADCPVLVYVYVTNNPACLALESQVFTDKSFRKLSMLFVMARVEATRRKDVADALGVTKCPALVFLDSAGDKVLMLDANVTPKRALNAMGRTFLVSLFNSGKREARAGHVHPALRRLRLVQIVGEGTPPAQWAQREIDALKAAGIKKLSQAQIAYDAKDYLKAMAVLDELLYEYRATSIGDEAKKFYDQLAGDPKAAEAFKEVDRRRLAARLLALAKKQDEKKDLEAALITYWDVTRDYPNTPAAEEAAARAAEIAKDNDLAGRAANARAKRDCENWLEMARACEQNKLRDKAVAFYQRVIDGYPDTPYAQKAREALTALGAAPKK